MDRSADDRPRIAALHSYGVHDTPNEAAFDAIVREAARVPRTPIALISLIDENRQGASGADRAAEGAARSARHADDGRDGSPAPAPRGCDAYR